MPRMTGSRLVAEMLPSALGENTLGMVLLNHGIFSFGETAQEAYDRMMSGKARFRVVLTMGE